VLTFTPEDNLMHPWKPDAAAERQPIKTTLLAADAPYGDHLAQLYQRVHGGKNPPPSPPGEGSFSEWAYFQYGRWSLACRGWWIPTVEPVAKASPLAVFDVLFQPAADPRGAEDLNALRWFAREKIDGFVDWKPIAHPDFPGRRVEVGGFKPFLRLNPPQGELEPLAERHWQFLRQVAELLPKIELAELKAEPLGAGVWRVTAVVVNRGYLPTMSRMGEIVHDLHPLQIKIELPKEIQLLTGSPRTQLPTLAGNGGKLEHVYLLRAPPDRSFVLPVRVWSPSMGDVEGKVELKKGAKG
jgi:hypothetical protein